LADFAVPAEGLARWRAQAILLMAYAFFRLSTGIKARRLAPPDQWLKEAGFRMAGRSEMEWGLLYSEVWSRRGWCRKYEMEGRVFGRMRSRRKDLLGNQEVRK
jgi:hypothetical protein